MSEAEVTVSEVIEVICSTADQSEVEMILTEI
jgi:hypothetical protein